MHEPALPGELKPFGCRKCGGALAIADADSVRCPYCGSLNDVPAGHRALVRAHSAPEELARANEAWRRYQRDALWAPTRVVAGFLPLPMYVLGIGAAAWCHANSIEFGVSPAVLVGVILWPALTAALLWAVHTMQYEYLTRQMPALRLSLAALPPQLAGSSPGCRRCGAPLPIAAGDLFARCACCGTQSLVTTDAVHARALVSEVEAVQASATEAIAERRRRAREATRAGRQGAKAFLALSALPLSWLWGRAAFPTLWSPLRLVWLTLTLLAVWVIGLLLVSVAMTAAFPPSKGLRFTRGSKVTPTGCLALTLWTALSLGSFYFPILWYLAFIAPAPR